MGIHLVLNRRRQPSIFTFAITKALPAVSGFAISSGTAILSAGREQIYYVVSQLYIGL